MQECCFVPQKPYMPLGTLRQQLLFPLSEDDAGRGADGVSDAELRSLASQVRLPSALRANRRFCAAPCACAVCSGRSFAVAAARPRT